MSAPAENSQTVELVIGEFPTPYANALKAEANAFGVDVGDLCADILRGHVARSKEGWEV